jgi:outer membrane protein assembly factor BamB
MRRIAVALAVFVVFSAPGAAANKPWRSLVLISAATGKVDRNFSDLDVRDAVADGRGGWFAAVGRRVVRLRPDGAIDPSLQTRLEGRLVRHVVRLGSRLYVTDAERMYAADTKTGDVIWRRQLPARVTAIAASGDSVYVAGQFRYFGRAPRDGLAALDARTGRLRSWRGPTAVRDGSTAGRFDAVAVDGPRLFVGGAFTSIGGRRRTNLALLSRSTGRLLPWRTSPKLIGGLAVPGDVDTVFAWHGTVLSAGHDGFGIFDARTGHIRPWISRLDGVASSFAGHGPLVYLGGDIRNSFRAADGYDRNNLAAFDLTTKKFTPWAPNVARYVSAAKIVPSGGQVLVAGFFSSTLG